MSNMRKDAYAVEVIGFNQTERIVLSSIFGLSARRQPKFVQHSQVSFAPDLFLVDASDAQAVALFNERNNMRRVPAIMIGENDHGMGYPLLSRPLQWTRLFKAFDSAIIEESAPQAQLERTQPMAAVAAPTSATTIASPPTQASHKPAVSRAPDFTLEATQVLQPITAPAAPAPTARTAPAIPSTTLPPYTVARTPTATPATPAMPVSFAPAPPAPAPYAPAKRSAFAPAPAPTPMPLPPAPAAPASLAPRVPVSTPPAPVETKPEADWVLVVDDNTTVREFMKSKLAPFNFNVDYAESGEQAVGLTGQRRYTCVFLDVVMPGIDGYQVCKLIKSKKSVGKTAVVMLTSKSSPFDKIRGAMAGCDAYLTKPVDEEKLLETIVRFIPTKV
jgi:CheY-like chemotaxis protein